MKRIEIYELINELGYDDERAVRTWCEKNDVVITKQGKSEYVFESNLKMALEKKFVDYLKNKHGDKWEGYYKLHNEGNLLELHKLNQGPQKTEMEVHSTKYKSRNSFTEEFEKYSKHKAA